MTEGGRPTRFRGEHPLPTNTYHVEDLVFILNDGAHGYTFNG